MFTLKKTSETKQKKYITNISNVASLSGLFASKSAAPYLSSRATERIFCDALDAEDLGRSDIAIDAKLENYGIGIKTFLHGNGKTLQKIAEFNHDNEKYRGLSPKEKINFIAKLRNERLQFSIDNYSIDKLIYHCITRQENGTINFYETPMDFIDIDNINSVKIKQNTISFNDKINEYSFNLTKSTLYKRFNFQNNKFLVASTKVKIIEDPLLVINNVLNSQNIKFTSLEKDKEYIILPLYSFSNSTGKIVNEKSGLNQWNAGGRKRNSNEVYIPISKKIHQSFPDFFPSRDNPFILQLPDNTNLNAKVCQDNSKALMSNPNAALGEWILRKVLKLKEKELLTYEKLAEKGVDSVKITKENNTTYSIDFCEIGTYDIFDTEHNIS